LTPKELMARYLREVIVYGEVELPNGDHLAFSPEAWLDCIKWVYTRVDGPPAQKLDVDNKTVFNFDPINMTAVKEVESGKEEEE